MNWSHEDIATAFANNEDLARANRGNSPLRASTGKSATIARPEPIPPVAPQKHVTGKPSGDRSTLRKLALTMSEADLQASIIELAHHYGYKVAHFRSVKVTKKDGSTFWQTPIAADGEGFFDLVLARAPRGGKGGEGIGRVLFVECKAQRGTSAPAQLEWAELTISTKRVEVYTWKPSDWLDGTIEGLLR